jgi:hypothetical protein
MSAFVVGTDHIDYLVTATLQWHGRHAVETLGLTPDQADAVTAAGGTVEHGFYGAQWRPDRYPDALGRLLLGENITSVRHRYPGEPDTDLPGPRPWVAAHQYTYRIVPYALLDAAQVIRAIECWQYQTCEYTDHEHAPGWAFTEQLYRVAVARLMGDRNDLAWEWSRPDPAA